MTGEWCVGDSFIRGLGTLRSIAEGGVVVTLKEGFLLLKVAWFRIQICSCKAGNSYLVALRHLFIYSASIS